MVKEQKVPVDIVAVAKLMTVDQLVAWLQVERATVYGWVHRRQIPFLKVGPKELMHGGARERDSRPLRFDYYEILEWLRTGSMPDRFRQ